MTELKPSIQVVIESLRTVSFNHDCLVREAADPDSGLRQLQVDILDVPDGKRRAVNRRVIALLLELIDAKHDFDFVTFVRDPAESNLIRSAIVIPDSGYYAASPEESFMLGEFPSTIFTQPLTGWVEIGSGLEYAFDVSQSNLSFPIPVTDWQEFSSDLLPISGLMFAESVPEVIHVRLRHEPGPEAPPIVAPLPGPTTASIPKSFGLAA